MERWRQPDLLERRKKAKKTLSLAKKQPLISQLITRDRAAETVPSAPTRPDPWGVFSMWGLRMREGSGK
jgi:hypothetical protein